MKNGTDNESRQHRLGEFTQGKLNHYLFSIQGMIARATTEVKFVRCVVERLGRRVRIYE